MNHSRRRFVLVGASAGTVLIAGCVETFPGDDSGGNSSDDTSGGNGEPCEKVDFMLVDEPPHEPERPPTPDSPDDWNEHYLGDGMADDSAVAFDRVDLRFHEPIVDPIDYGDESVFYAELITSRDEFDERVASVGTESEDRVAAIDFDEEAVVAVLSGFGSSSVRHEWVRVDSNCNELHLHGYYVQPYVQTDDVTSRVSGVVLEKPDELERVWVSVTTGEDTRVNFPTDEDVQVVNGDDDDGDGGDDDDGAIDRTQVVPVESKSPGGWRSDATDDTGVVVQLEDQEEVRAITRADDNVDRFIDMTDFDDDTAFFLESAGPNTCYRTIEVTDVAVARDGRSVTGDATVVDESGDEEGCDEVVTYPAVLVRVASDGTLSSGEFRITDGWGNEETIESISMREFVQE